MNDFILQPPTGAVKDIGVGLTSIENNIRFLKMNGHIERVGSNKTGYWKVKG